MTTDGALPLGKLGPPGVTIRQGHALDLITGVKQVDLIATDPPYAFSGEGSEHALGAVVANVLRESAYRLRKGGWAVVFAASSWRSTYYMIEPPEMVGRRSQLPARVAHWAVQPFAVPGGVRLDPFSGSGVLCRAAAA